jgi:hypothetical protein
VRASGHSRLDEKGAGKAACVWRVELH